MTKQDVSPAGSLAEERVRTGLLLAADPLPTRTRPGPSIDPAVEWASYRHALTQLPNYARKRHAAWKRVAPYNSDTPPASIEPAALADWLLALDKLWEAEVYNLGHTGTALDNLPNACLAAVSRWAVAALDTRTVVAAILKVWATASKDEAYVNLAWAEPLAVGLRHALPAVPVDAYDAAIAQAVAALPAHPGAEPFLAFVFADDRADTSHALHMRAPLDVASAQSPEPENTKPLLPLLAEVPLAIFQQWQQTRAHLMYSSDYHLSSESIAATVMANARQRGESALPVLLWMLEFPPVAHDNVLPYAVLESREDGALASLLPRYHDAKVRAALDAAAQVYPIWSFQQLSTRLAEDSKDVVVKARLHALIEQHGDAVVQAWAAELNPPAHAAFDALSAQRAQSQAAHDALPDLLQRMPWRSLRKKSAQAEQELALTPVPTPFAVKPDAWSIDPSLQNDRVVIDDLEKLGDYIHLNEKFIGHHSWRAVPAPNSLPAPGALTGEQWTDWLCERFATLSADDFQIGRMVYVDVYSALHRHHERLALALWAQGRVLARAKLEWEYVVAQMVARFGERTAPGLAGLVEAAPVEILPLALAVDSAELVPKVAVVLGKSKQARPHAMAWLRQYRRTAMLRLIPDAVGPAGSARDAAEQILRWFVDDAEDGRAALMEATARYETQDPRVRDAIEQMLARDPADVVPPKPAKLPAWFQPAALTRPVLASGAGALSDDAVRGLAEMLSLSALGAPHPGIARVRTDITPDSLADFAWDLFSLWLAEGAPAKDNWALRAVGWLGNDDSARRLTALIRKWPGEAAHARAVTGLDALADIGSDIALMHLNGIAEKLKFKGLQEKAREKIAVIAEARDLTANELADRLVPDLGLDERGGLDLDFGPRSFRVGFDEFLKPWVRDAEGKRLKDLPKPAKSDDAALAKQASATWSGLKKNVRAVASLQLARLENMLVDARRVDAAVFDTFFVKHPLVRHLTQRLVWGVFPDHGPDSAPAQVFRIADDLSAGDVDDAPVEIAADALIGLVHPVHLDEPTRSAWSTLLADYEIAQPFAQLTRETHALAEDERGLNTLDRFSGVEVATTRLRGMNAHGWRIGAPQDSGVALWLERPVRFVDGTHGTVYLNIDEGIFLGAHEAESVVQKMGVLSLDKPLDVHRKNPSARRFQDLVGIDASEMLRVPTDVTRHAGA